MAYRDDEDLKFLGQLSDEELAPLVDILIKDTDGSGRPTETLTLSDEYKNFGSCYSQYWKRIAEELQLFGGDTIANLFRGGDGVLYREILTDVAEKLDIKFNKYDPTQDIEQSLLLKFFDNISEHMPLEDLHHNVKASNTIHQSTMVAAGILGMLSILVKKGLLRGLPAGLMATSPLLALSSPAFRVTIPAVVCVAALRANYLQEKMTERSKNVGINLAILGKTGVGKSTFCNYVFGENLFRTGSGKPVTNWSENLQPHTTNFLFSTLNIFDSVGIETNNFERWNKEFNTFLDRNVYLHHPPAYWVHGVFYLLNATQPRFEKVEEQIIQTILDKKVPLYIVLTHVDKVDAATREEFKRAIRSKFDKDDLHIYEVCSVEEEKRTRVSHSFSFQHGKEELLLDFLGTLEQRIKTQLCCYSLYQAHQQFKVLCKQLRHKVSSSDISFWNLVKKAIKNEDLDELLLFNLDNFNPDFGTLKQASEGVYEFISSIDIHYIKIKESTTEQALQQAFTEIIENLEAKQNEVLQEFEQYQFDLEEGDWWEKAKVIVNVGSIILSPKEFFLKKIDELSQTIDDEFTKQIAIFDHSMQAIPKSLAKSVTSFGALL